MGNEGWSFKKPTEILTFALLSFTDQIIYDLARIKKFFPCTCPYINRYLEKEKILMTIMAYMLLK